MSSSLACGFSGCETFQDKYELLEKLGEGSSGVVYRCRRIKTDEIFAVKSFQFEDQHLASIRANFVNMKRLDFPHLVRYEALYIDLRKHMAWLVMEYVGASSLGRALGMSEDEMRGVVQQLLQTLNYLHLRGVVHRDVKIENVLYDRENRRITLIDFGICKRFKRREQRVEMWTVTGTLYYRAPQIFLGGGYREGVDVWAVGILLYKMVAGRTPFQSEYRNETVKNILEKELEFSSEFKEFSHLLRAFVSRLLNRNPKERVSAFEALKDVWFYPIPSHMRSHLGSLN